MKIKEGYMFIHAKDRADSRYNIDLTPKIHSDLIKIIKRGNNKKCRLLATLLNGRIKYKISYNYRDYIVIYDRKLKQIVTFLECGDDTYRTNIKKRK